MAWTVIQYISCDISFMDHSSMALAWPGQRLIQSKKSTWPNQTWRNKATRKNPLPCPFCPFHPRPWQVKGNRTLCRRLVSIYAVSCSVAPPTVKSHLFLWTVH